MDGFEYIDELDDNGGDLVKSATGLKVIQIKVQRSFE